MRIANAILLLLLVLGSNVYALNVSQIYSGSGERCLQLTPSNITCPDGIPIVTSFALSSQSYPYYYYGNFTAYALRGENMSSPVNAYGEPCTVSSSSTSVCFVTIPPVRDSRSLRKWRCPCSFLPWIEHRICRHHICSMCRTRCRMPTPCLCTP